ncbi:hypothetical protein TorRG33x02_175810, partial [Trema orientale]
PEDPLQYPDNLTPPFFGHRCTAQAREEARKTTAPRGRVPRSSHHVPSSTTLVGSEFPLTPDPMSFSYKSSSSREL